MKNNALMQFCQCVIAFFNKYFWMDNADMHTKELINALIGAADLSDLEKNSAAIARKAGMEQSTVFRLLTGRVQDPRISTFLSVANACGLQIVFENKKKTIDAVALRKSLLDIERVLAATRTQLEPDVKARFIQHVYEKELEGTPPNIEDILSFIRHLPALESETSGQP